MMKQTTILFILICMLFSRTGKKTPNVDNINVDIVFERFDKDVFAEKNIDEMQEKYGDFYNKYCEFIIGVGHPDSANFAENMQRFLSDSIVQIAQSKANTVFDANIETLKSEIVQVLKYYKYYFPQGVIPKIYTFTSGFNQSLILDENVVGVGLDKYLGADEEIYQKLGFSKYLSRNMRKEKIASELARVLAIDNFPFIDGQYTLIDKMIYEGKLLYFAQQLCPNLADTTLFGFTSAQLKFCKNNEAQMWTVLVENKLLYGKNYTTINMFTEDVPFTPDFTQESPGRAANWIGLQIVKKYIKNTDATLPELMRETNYEQILSKSKYNPKR